MEDWRARSLAKFTKLMQKYDTQFTEDKPVVSEVFEVVYSEK
ncbi:hypothetical protein [Pediococcus pentosaceus]|nr:hypothetical protein [Pediococcus pentosaceus]